MKSDINYLENIQHSRTTTYFDSDAAFAEAHLMWNSISDAQHQHEHEMMMQAIEELEEEDLKGKKNEGNSSVLGQDSKLIN